MSQSGHCGRIKNSQKLLIQADLFDCVWSESLTHLGTYGSYVYLYRH
jgi:hypothetical protein